MIGEHFTILLQVILPSVFDMQWNTTSDPIMIVQDITVHYNAVIIDAIASQITSVTIVYSTVNSDADQRKYQSSASLAFVRWIPRTNDQ